MPSFILKDAPGAYVYRPLKLKDFGWDVFALQTALQTIGLNLGSFGTDGYFGSDTKNAVIEFQGNNGLEADGIAGIVTQTYTIKRIAPGVTKTYGLPKNALKGQIEKESGNQLGNHSLTYDNGSVDLGVTQMNSNYHDYELAFHVGDAIQYLGQTIRVQFDLFSDPACAERLRARGLPQTDPRRRWELAQGYWNRPSHASYLAGAPMGVSSKPTPAQVDWLEAYIDRVTCYVTEWPTK